MIDIHEIERLLHQKQADPSFVLRWIPPETITGLSRTEILYARKNKTGWSSETDGSQTVFNYLRACYRQGDSCLLENASMSLTEHYVRAMTYLVVEYQSSLAAVEIPDRVDVRDARNCLPFFVDVLLNRELDESEIAVLQQYVCDFYQVDDLWDPPEGRFRQELTAAENMLLKFLGTRDLRVNLLMEFGVPDEITRFVGDTKLIKHLKTTKGKQ